MTTSDDVPTNIEDGGINHKLRDLVESGSLFTRMQVAPVVRV